MDAIRKQQNRTLVDRALKMAEEHEKQGNKEKAAYFFKIAERAEKVYDKLYGKR